MTPEGLCIYCGHARPPSRPQAPCAGCCRSAEGVRWWQVRRGGRSATPVALAVLLVALSSATALRAASDAVASYVVLTLVTLLVASPLVRGLFRRGYGTWYFAAPDGAHIGSATWDGAQLFWAYGLHIEGPSVEVPEYARAITAAAVRAAGVRALGPGVCLALEIDEAEYDGLFFEGALAPTVAAALVGLGARGSCALRWQRGWRFSHFASPRVAPLQRLSLTASAAPAEAGPFERELLALIAEVEGANAALWAPRAEPQRDAHYRAQALGPAPRYCTLDDLASELSERPPRRDELIASVVPDPSQASDAALAFRAFAASQPEVVEHLVDAFTEEEY